MRCVVCKNFYPPGFTEPIPDTIYHKCKFCKEGKDSMLVKSNITGDLHWDNKDQIVSEYKMYINKLAKNREARSALIKGIEK